MKAHDLEREILFPVDLVPFRSDELLRAGDSEGLRHGVVIVEESLSVHARVLLERVVVLQPSHHRGNAGIIAIHLRVDEGKQAGVAHAAVTAEGGALFAVVALDWNLVGLGVGGEVDKAAFVFFAEAEAVTDPFDRGLGILNQADEIDGRLPVEIEVVALVIFRVGEYLPGVVKGFHREVRVGQVGVRVAAAVADAAVEEVVRFTSLVEVLLLVDEQATCFGDDGQMFFVT